MDPHIFRSILQSFSFCSRFFVFLSLVTVSFICTRLAFFKILYLSLFSSTFSCIYSNLLAVRFHLALESCVERRRASLRRWRRDDTSPTKHSDDNRNEKKIAKEEGIWNETIFKVECRVVSSKHRSPFLRSLRPFSFLQFIARLAFSIDRRSLYTYIYIYIYRIYMYIYILYIRIVHYVNAVLIFGHVSSVAYLR